MLQAQSNHETLTICIIAVGSNLPSPAGSVADTVRVALRLLDAGPTRILHQARLYETPAYPPGSGPDFVNSVVEVETSLGAHDLLQHLHAIESRMGRTRTTRWEARVLDLDLIGFGAMVLPDIKTYKHWCALPAADQARLAPPHLILPHPRMHERGFVLVPLADIAPDWRHPVLGQTAAELLAALAPEATQGIHPLPV